MGFRAESSVRALRPEPKKSRNMQQHDGKELRRSAQDQESRPAKTSRKTRPLTEKQRLLLSSTHKGDLRYRSKQKADMSAHAGQNIHHAMIEHHMDILDDLHVVDIDV